MTFLKQENINKVLTHYASQCKGNKNRNDNYLDSPKAENRCMDLLKKQNEEQGWKNT